LTWRRLGRDRYSIEQTGFEPALAKNQPAIDRIGTTRAAFAATIGNMLEFYDFITYSFFATAIGHAFFPTQSEYGSLMLSLATFGAGFVTRPIGGIILGIYSDRVGRRPAMLLSFAMMGTAIILISLTPSYASIGIAAPIIVIIARLIQGLHSVAKSAQPQLI
jgi:MFS transporter, MHS family, citrate/tricarballylate:H+ symporter